MYGSLGHKMTKIDLFDLHCDTLYELYKKKLCFDNHQTMINTSTVALFRTYRQVFAFWSDYRLSYDEQWVQYQKGMDYAKHLRLPGKPIFAVEGASLLDGKLERVEALAHDGIKILTMVWQGTDFIGGAHDTFEGFTPFGQAVFESCAKHGIIADFSHASDRMIEEALTSNLPVICTHSNSREIFNHTRNLQDEFFKEISARGGVVGLSFAGSHIGGECTFKDLARHYEHFLKLGGENTVCLGCDLDGISYGPKEFKNQSSLPMFREFLLKEGFGEALVNKLFFDNASRFCQRLL